MENIDTQADGNVSGNTAETIQSTVPVTANGFTDFMAGYDNDGELQGMFPLLKEAGFTSKTFNDVVPNETKETLKNVFKQLGFNQRQANAAMILAADSYCNGTNNGAAPYLKQQEEAEAQRKQQEETEAKNAEVIKSEEFSGKLNTLNKIIDLTNKLGYDFDDNEMAVFNKLTKSPAGISLLAKMADGYFSYADGKAPKVQAGQSSVISADTAGSVSDGYKIDGSNYENFDFDAQRKFLRSVKSGEIKDAYLTPRRAGEIDAELWYNREVAETEKNKDEKYNFN